jgi:hypothetical protein
MIVHFWHNVGRPGVGIIKTFWLWPDSRRSVWRMFQRQPSLPNGLAQALMPSRPTDPLGPSFVRRCVIRWCPGLPTWPSFGPAGYPALPTFRRTNL